jgi:hypothetical protein
MRLPPLYGPPACCSLTLRQSDHHRAALAVQNW